MIPSKKIAPLTPVSRSIFWVKRILNHIANSIPTQALLVGLTATLPLLTYLLITNSVIAPLNTLNGWDTSPASQSVVAEIPSDVNQQMLPFRKYVKESLSEHGEVPLWNSKSFAGDVFAANPINTALSPLNILLFVTDIYTFQNLIVLAGLFFSIFAMYLLLRQLKLSPLAGVLGSLAYALAPFSIFWSIYGIVTIPMSALPLVLYFYYKWSEKPRINSLYLIAIVLTLGLVVYLGHIQIAILPYIGLLLAVLFDAVRRKLLVKNMLFIMGGFLIGVLIASAQIIPMLLQTPQSHRSTEITAEQPREWSRRVDELIGIPQAYSLSDGPTTLGLTLRREANIGQVPGILFIIGSLVLVVQFIRSRKITVFHFYLLLFLLGISWAWNDFPQTILGSLSPTVRSLASDYFLPLALVSMSVLAAYGLHWIQQLFIKSVKKAYRPKLMIFHIAMIFVLIVLSIFQLRLGEVTTLGVKYYAAYYVCLGLLVLSLFFTRKYKYTHLVLGITLSIITLLQGMALLRVTQPIVPKTITDIGNARLTYVESQSKNNPYIVDYIGPQESGLYNISLLNGYDSLYSSSLQDRIKAINYPNKTPANYRNNSLVINTTTKPTLFKNLGVNYTINNVPESGYSEVYDGVYQSDQPTDLVYFAQSLSNQSKAEQLKTLESGRVAYREVVIDGDYPIASKDSTASYSRTANSITIHTESTSGGLLFIAQTYNPDWMAKLDDGTSLQIIPAYYDFTAINVPAGSQTITLRYQPSATIASILLSIITILVILAVLTYTLLKKSKISSK